MPRILKIKDVCSEISFEEALNDFLNSRKADGLREATIQGYKQFNNQFFRTYPDAWHNDEVLEKASNEWLAGCNNPSTYNLRLTYVRKFIDYCVDKGIYRRNPFRGRKIRKTNPRNIKADIDTLTKLIRLPDRTTYSGLRDYAMILLELDTGIRPKELLNVMPEHFNLKARELFVPAEICKTNTDRTVHFSDDTAKAIRRLYEVRPKWFDSNAPLFCNSLGKPLQISGWRKRLKEYGKMIGINLTPYALRHIFAYQYLKNGGDYKALQLTMGHSTMEMTSHYVYLASEDLKEDHDKVGLVGRVLMKKRRAGKIKNKGE